MPPKWKIIYTDGTGLKWNEVADADPSNIPDPKRVGVHSVLQEIENNTMRETIETYHYIFRRSDAAWLGIGYDGLLDHIVHDLDDILCVMHGRTMALERFWRIKQAAAVDQDITSWSTMKAIYEDTERIHSWLRNMNTNYYSSGQHGNWHDPNTEYWTEVSIKSAYDKRFMESGPYGHQGFYH